MSKFGRWTKGTKNLSEVLTITPEEERLLEVLKQKKVYPKQKERTKAQEEEAEKFRRCMIGIVDVLPIEYEEKEEIANKVIEYSTEFPLYAQCQSNDSEEENPWITSLLPLSLMIVDNIGEECEETTLYKNAKKR